MSNLIAPIYVTLNDTNIGTYLFIGDTINNTMNTENNTMNTENNTMNTENNNINTENNTMNTENIFMNTDNLTISYDSIRSDVQTYMIFIYVCCMAILITILMYFPSKPPLRPSVLHEEEIANLKLKVCWKRLITNIQVILLAIAFGLISAVLMTSYSFLSG